MNEAAAHTEDSHTNMMAGPSIVTVTYNSAEVLSDFLASLMKDECHPRVRVYVVDNGSTDDSIAIARSFEQNLDLIVIPNRKQPRGGGWEQCRNHQGIGRRRTMDTSNQQ